MRLILLTVLTMFAFAANSVLNRMALIGDDTGPAAFALIRLASGALFLLFLVNLRGRPAKWRAPNQFWRAATLALYVLGFSFAYLSLNAGIGALILFGGVQITMFIGALRAGETVPKIRWIGAGVAFAGLALLLWPVGAFAPDPAGVALMIAAAIGWGAYSLLGRGAGDPLGATAVNFTLALPVGLAMFLVFPDSITPTGAVLAVISGAVMSGAGYALWYTVLPRMPATTAAVAQLTVPVIAVAGGLVFLGEPLTLRFILATILVLGGVIISLRHKQTPGRHS